MNDTPTLVKFTTGFVEDGSSPEDGLPVFRETVMITLARPPLLRIDREATDQDFEDYSDAYHVYTRQRDAVKPGDASPDAYPLAYWPVIGPAELEMCTARGVVTVQQLAQLCRKGADTTKLPPAILELSRRAAKMIELQKSHGKYEVIINRLTAERDALAEQMKEANATISAQNSMINALKNKVA
jgi:hypothetical protein